MAATEHRGLSDAEENYHESSDEDFNPTGLPADESSSSDDEAESAPTTTKSAQRNQKRKAPSPADLDSGDEVTIQTARKRRAKKRKGDTGGEDDILFSDDEGGEGGLIKTRAQRRTEQKERKPLARTDGATVDVDALWAQMSAAPLVRTYSTSTSKQLDDSNLKTKIVPADVADGVIPADNETDFVAVKRIYRFAGQRTIEEKRIPPSSLEQYISDGWKPAESSETQAVIESEETQPNDVAPEDASKKLHRRPLRRPSRFDPNPTGQVRGLPPDLQLTWPRKVAVAPRVDQENAQTPVTATAGPRLEKAQKLNVVDKSRLDWTGYVDKEGIADELQEHGKAKEAYLGRMDFLAGVEARREEERKRLKGLAAS